MKRCSDCKWDPFGDKPPNCREGGNLLSGIPERVKSVLLTITLIFGVPVLVVLLQTKTQAQEPNPKTQGANDETARQKADRLFLRNASRRPDFSHGDDLRQVGRPQIKGPTAIRPSSEQKVRLNPEPGVVSKYSEILKGTGARVVKLFPDMGCVEQLVVKTDKACLDSIPYSSFYSFRKANYSDRPLSDIGFKSDLFFTDGLLANGVIVSLGDVPFESLTTSSAGMRFLMDFEPASQLTEIVAKGRQMAGKVRNKGHDYGWTAPVRENTTYAIRMIAYRGQIIRSAGKGYFYNALDGDKRVDVVVAFRVVSKGSDGSITMLWRELQQKRSPKIQVAKRK